MGKITKRTSAPARAHRSRIEGLLGVAGALQRAATPHDVQSAYLEAIPALVGARGHGIYVLDPTNSQPVDVVATVPDSFLQRYEDEGRDDDPVLQGAMATKAPVDSSRLPEGLCWTTSAVFPVLQAAGFRHSLEAPVLVEGEVQATLNMVRQPDDKPFSEEDLRSMGLIADQVGGALTRAQRYDQVARDTLVLADALDAAPQPIVITTVDGELIFRNRMAARPVPGSSFTYLERARPILSEALGELRGGVKRVVTTFEHAGASAGARVGGPGGGGKADRAALEGGQDRGLVAVKSIRLRSHLDAVVSFVSHRATDTPGLPGGSLPLSPREWGIADLVSRGLTNRQIAELAYVSENTVKQHLKRIFTKLEVSSRAELVQTVWAASTTRHDGAHDGAHDGMPDPDRGSLTELP